MPRGRLQLSVAGRLIFALVGIALLVVGLAGLALPGIQGILTLIAALACLSFASDRAHHLLRWTFRRWPRGWRRFLRGRLWIEERLGLRRTTSTVVEDEPVEASPDTNGDGTED